MNAGIDVRDVLPNVRVPTLVIHRTHDARIRFAGGRFIAERIAGARFAEIEDFLTGSRSESTHQRVLGILLVTRLVAPGRSAVRLDDHRWSERVERFR